MIKVSVMYANTPGARFDHTYLIKARLGNACKHYSVDKGLAGEPAPYVGQTPNDPNSSRTPIRICSSCFRQFEISLGSILQTAPG
jgi:hypothetical protein